MDMKRRATVLAATAVAAMGMVTGPPLAAQADDHASHGHDRPSATSIARQVLPAGDGWASATTGTTGGAAAPRTSVVTVRTRDQLAQAVSGDEPKIVFVSGRIDANTDATGRRLTCEDYARNGYTLQQYLKAYDPEVWGRENEPSGPVEDARRASQQAQAERVTIRIGSNTTLIGRSGAEITGANLRIDQTSNVILRGLTVTDAYDCFPAWDPTDGETGNWNSEYDTLFLTGADHVWIDHNEFSDADNLDSNTADVLRAALPGARRANRHHQRVGPGHRVVQPAPRPRQDHADRLERLADHRPGEAAGDGAPQRVPGPGPTRATRALRSGGRLQQSLRRASGCASRVRLLLGDRRRVTPGGRAERVHPAEVHRTRADHRGVQGNLAHREGQPRKRRASGHRGRLQRGVRTEPHRGACLDAPAPSYGPPDRGGPPGGVGAGRASSPRRPGTDRGRPARLRRQPNRAGCGGPVADRQRRPS